MLLVRSSLLGGSNRQHSQPDCEKICQPRQSADCPLQGERTLSFAENEFLPGVIFLGDKVSMTVYNYSHESPTYTSDY